MQLIDHQLCPVWQALDYSRWKTLWASSLRMYNQLYELGFRHIDEI